MVELLREMSPYFEDDVFFEGRGSCSPQSVMLDFMTTVVGVVQVTISIAAAVKSDKNDNNNNDNNNNNNNNNNNFNINDDNVNFMMMGMQNMMAMGGRYSSKIVPNEFEHCLSYFFCSLKDRRQELKNLEELGLKTVK